MARAQRSATSASAAAGFGTSSFLLASSLGLVVRLGRGRCGGGGGGRCSGSSVRGGLGRVRGERSSAGSGGCVGRLGFRVHLRHVAGSLGAGRCGRNLL